VAKLYEIRAPKLNYIHPTVTAVVAATEAAEEQKKEGGQEGRQGGQEGGRKGAGTEVGSDADSDTPGSMPGLKLLSKAQVGSLVAQHQAKKEAGAGERTEGGRLAGRRDTSHDRVGDRVRDRVRVGVFTHHLRSHSVCRFMCGLWKHLDRSLFDVSLITDLEVCVYYSLIIMVQSVDGTVCEWYILLLVQSFNSTVY
jgi:hypothetical protein